MPCGIWSASALLHYWVRSDRKQWIHLVPGLGGFLICAYLWVSLSRTAQIAGWIWLILGIAYGAWKTNGFRKPMPKFEEAVE